MNGRGEFHRLIFPPCDLETSAKRGNFVNTTFHQIRTSHTRLGGTNTHLTCILLRLAGRQTVLASVGVDPTRVTLSFVIPILQSSPLFATRFLLENTSSSLLKDDSSVREARVGAAESVGMGTDLVFLLCIFATLAPRKFQRLSNPQILGESG